MARPMPRVFHREYAGRPIRVLWMFESAAICLQLADQAPNSGTIGALGSHERALDYQWSIFAPSELEPPLIEAAIFHEADPARAGKARSRFFKAADAVARGLDHGRYLVGARFGVADVLVSTALSFTQRARFPEPLSPVLESYAAGLFERPGYRRALERASATPAST